VAVSVDEPPDTAALLDRLAGEGTPLAFPLLCDPSRAAVKAFGVHDRDHDIALPAIVLLDAQGRVAWRHAGTSIFDRPDEDELARRARGLSSPPAGR
jgi:peroxiredoxin